MQVRWQGRDAEGRPVLVVRVAQACQECSSTAAEELSRVIVSQVSRFRSFLALTVLHSRSHPSCVGALASCHMRQLLCLRLEGVAIRAAPELCELLM